MKQLLILGAGTAGTMMANHLRKKADLAQWKITIVDQYPMHYYQPGFLFMPFGLYSEADVAKQKRKFIPKASISWKDKWTVLRRIKIWCGWFRAYQWIMTC